MIFLPIEVSADQSTSQEYTEVLTPYEQNGMWGYTDRTGSIVIQPQWAVAGGIGAEPQPFALPMGSGGL